MLIRKVILMLALGLTCSSAMAEWTEVSLSEEVVVYVDNSTIRKSGKMSKVWMLLDSRTSDQLVMGKPFLSVKSRIEFNCNEDKSRILSSSFFSKQLGYGKVVITDSNLQEWHEIDPDSVERDMFNIACGKH